MLLDTKSGPSLPTLISLMMIGLPTGSWSRLVLGVVRWSRNGLLALSRLSTPSLLRPSFSVMPGRRVYRMTRCVDSAHVGSLVGLFILLTELFL